MNEQNLPMITFITDRLPNEPEILLPLKHLPLQVRTLENEPIARFDPPENGWTHDDLMETARRIDDLTVMGADAYLGDDWVGSTEV